MTSTCATARTAARQIVDRVGQNIVLGLPIGIGKATAVADALYELACDDTSLSLTIFTGLTLEPPVPTSDLEARLLDPEAALLRTGTGLDLLQELDDDGPVPRVVHRQSGMNRPGRRVRRLVSMHPGR